MEELMKKIMVAVVLLVASLSLFAGNPKEVIVGFLDQDGTEFTAGEVAGLTFKTWLEQGTGAAIVAGQIFNQVSPGNSVLHYGDIRGSAWVNMQNFTNWGVGNILYILMKDENDGLKAYFEKLHTWNIDDGSVAPTERGFEDYFGFGGFPQLINDPSSIEESMLPTETKLYQNYPNPFNPTTAIKFDLATAGNVRLNVYNYNGQLLQSLVNGTMNAGVHSVNFDASSLSAGVYYYTLEAGNSIMSNKMILVK